LEKYKIKTQVPVIIDVELLKQVDDYLHENRLKNRSKFICDLVIDKLALKSEKIKSKM
jgi:metal-responsive CopG/Arc/MetJ family transcriptional regulator